jgi:hypothetical protein
LTAARGHGSDVLGGLTDIPWGDLTHAYGPAEDVPVLLRAIAHGDDKAASDGVHALFGNIWHQGTVYRATPYAVPFLARMAVAGIKTSELLQLLGCIAESEDDATGGDSRAAVAVEAGTLAFLLRDPAPDVRVPAAWALAQSRAGDDAFAAVQAQWAAEEDPVVRPTLLKAMSELAPAHALPMAVQAATHGARAGERLVAAWICVAAGQPWDDTLRSASLAWLSEGLELDNGWWGDSNSGPFACLLSDLADRGDFDVAIGLCFASMELASAPGILQRAMWDVDQFTDEYRVPVPELTAVLEQLTPGVEASRTVSSLLARLRPQPSPSAGSGRQTGVPTLTLTEIKEKLQSRHGMLPAARAARVLNSAPEWLIPALRAALVWSASQEHASINGRIEVARALWHFTGDAETVVSVIAEGFQAGNPRQWFAFTAATNAVGDLGPAGARFVPNLLRLLAEPASCPTAAEALFRVDPDLVSIPLAELAEYLAIAVGAEAGHFHMRAIDLLREISRRDPTAISAGSRGRLRDYAERPRRVIRSGNLEEIIRRDEALRVALRDFLTSGNAAADGERPGRQCDGQPIASKTATGLR